MLVERAEILIKEGLETGFAAAMAERGLVLLKNVAGVKTVSLGRGVENPGKFMLLVEWESMEAHTGFTTDPVFPVFRAVFAPFSAGGSMEHFKIG